MLCAAAVASPQGNYDPIRSLASASFGDPVDNLGDSIPGGGTPGDDYPILAQVPDTGFSCSSQPSPGYYADTSSEARCQVFHICGDNERTESFLCPNGTLFNQRYFVCDWWFNVRCEDSQSFYQLNENIGKQLDPLSNTPLTAASSFSKSQSQYQPPS